MNIPPEIWDIVFSFCTINEYQNIALVNRYWCTVLYDGYNYRTCKRRVVQPIILHNVGSDDILDINLREWRCLERVLTIKLFGRVAHNANNAIVPLLNKEKHLRIEQLLIQRGVRKTITIGRAMISNALVYRTIEDLGEAVAKTQDYCCPYSGKNIILVQYDDKFYSSKPRFVKTNELFAMGGNLHNIHIIRGIYDIITSISVNIGVITHISFNNNLICIGKPNADILVTIPTCQSVFTDISVIVLYEATEARKLECTTKGEMLWSHRYGIQCVHKFQLTPGGVWCIASGGMILAYNDNDISR